MKTIIKILLRSTKTTQTVSILTISKIYLKFSCFNQGLTTEENQELG